MADNDSLVAGGGSLNSLIQTYQSKRAQDRLVKNFTFYNFADKKEFPKNSGQTYQFRRYTNIAGSTTTLAEAAIATTGLVQLTATTGSFALARYGKYVTLSNFGSMTAPDTLVNEATDVIADYLSDTVDLLCRDALAVSATAYIPNGKTTATLTNSDVLDGDDIRKIARNLTAANARTFDDGYYAGIMSPYHLYDLQSDTAAGGWLQTSQYSKPDKIYKGEVGMLYGIRMIHSNNCPTASVTSSVTSAYISYVTAAHAFAAASLDSSPTQIIVNKPGSGGSYDPFRSIVTVAGVLQAFGAGTLVTSGETRAIKITSAITV
jgi:N4-gp56 family major capsid protein